MATEDYAFAAEVLRSGERAKLEALAESLVGFPEGVDSWLGRRWILNAVDVGARSTIEWMLEKRVNLAFRDEEGYTALFAVIDSQRADRYDLLELLLRAGAPVNLKGRNEWTSCPSGRCPRRRRGAPHPGGSRRRSQHSNRHR